jgi:hypothetical protein
MSIFPDVNEELYCAIFRAARGFREDAEVAVFNIKLKGKSHSVAFDNNDLQPGEIPIVWLRHFFFRSYRLTLLRNDTAEVNARIVVTSRRFIVTDEVVWTLLIEDVLVDETESPSTYRMILKKPNVAQHKMASHRARAGNFAHVVTAPQARP